MSQFEASKIFNQLVRCPDLETVISGLEDEQVRGLSEWLVEDAQ